MVIHKFDVDFDKLKVGDIYESLCGRRYMSDEPPTQSEASEIAEKTVDWPVCKRCLRKRPTSAKAQGEG